MRAERPVWIRVQGLGIRDEEWQFLFWDGHLVKPSVLDHEAWEHAELDAHPTLKQLDPEPCHRLLRIGMQKLVAAAPALALAARPEPRATASPLCGRHLICLPVYNLRTWNKQRAYLTFRATIDAG